MPIRCFRISIILLTVLVVGCAGQVKMLPTLTPSTVLKENQGVVVARVINASGYPLPFNQLTITPESVNESKESKFERLLAVRSNTVGTTAFSSPVKAGTYALSSLRAFHSNGNFWYSRFANADVKFGTFSVEPGAITDLGTLIYYPKSQDDKYVNMLLRLPESEQGEVLNTYFPFFADEGKSYLSWHQDDLDDERASNYASVVQNPVYYNLRYLAPDGTLYFLSKFGVIMTRSIEGEWSLDAVDTNLELTTITQNERGDIVGGGGEGTLFLKKAGGQWSDISLGSHYKVEKVLFRDEDTLDLIATEKNKINILRANINELDSDWQELNSFSTIGGWKSIPIPERKKKSSSSKEKQRKPKVIVGVSLLELGADNYITVRQIGEQFDPVFARASTKTFSYDAADWNVQPIEKEPAVSSVIDAGAIKLGIKLAGFWSWDGKTDYMRYVPESDSWEEVVTHVNRCKGGLIIEGTVCPDPANKTEDNGEEKKRQARNSRKETLKSRRKSFTFRSVPVFSSPLDATALVSFTDFNAWTGERKNETKLLITTNGGKSWLASNNSLPHDYCASMIPEVTDRLLISCNGASSDFYESFDGGKTWDHVRQHENF